MPEAIFFLFALLVLAVAAYVIFARPAPLPAPDRYASLRDDLERSHADRDTFSWWVLRTDGGKVKSLPIPEQHLRAILVHLQALHGDDLTAWWSENRARIHAHEDSKLWLDERIN